MPFLPGFDERWRDAPDFIDGTLREIWTDRRLDRIAKVYAGDAVVHAGPGLLRGRDAIRAEAQSRLSAMPDIAFFPEETIWAQSGYKSVLAARRLWCRATHDGPGLYGAPTGRDISHRVMTDLWCRGNEIAEEWRVADTLAILNALGEAPDDWARRAVAAQGGPERCAPPLSPETEVPPRFDGKGNTSPWGQTLSDIVTRAMAGEIAVLARQYDPAAEVTYPGGQPDSGPAAAERFWGALRASLPSARFAVQSAMGEEDAPASPRAALRWTLTGRHDGWGLFGAPSGAELLVMGMTQSEFGPDGLRREWTLVDVPAVWMQIVLARGDG